MGNYGEEVLAKAKNRVEKSALKLAGLEGLVLADVDAARLWPGGAQAQQSMRVLWHRF